MAMNLETLFCNAECSDLVLLVEGQRIPSHKLVLARRSDYFRKLVFSQDELELKDTPLTSFIAVLQYMYTGRITTDTKLDFLPTVLELAHRYQLPELEHAMSERLKQSLSERNFPIIFGKVRSFEWSDVPEACLRFADDNAMQVIKSQTLLDLSSEALYDVISRDSFAVPEMSVFKLVCAWLEHNPTVDQAALLSAVRLSQMTQEEMLNVVLPTHLFPTKDILEATQKRTQDSKPRCVRVANKNIATQKSGAKVIEGILGSEEDVFNNIRSSPNIVVELDKPYLLNSVMMNLVQYPCAYYVEVSTNKAIWTKVIDYERVLCSGQQMLCFRPQAVKYIRIVCTRNESYDGLNDVPTMILEQLTCAYKANLPPFSKGILYAQSDMTKFLSWPRETESLIGRCNQPYLMDTLKIPGYEGYIRVCGFSDQWEDVFYKDGVRGVFAFPLREVSCIQFFPKVPSELDLDVLCSKVVCSATVVPPFETEEESRPNKVSPDREEIPARAATAIEKKPQIAPWNIAMALVAFVAIFVALIWLDKQ